MPFGTSLFGSRKGSVASSKSTNSVVEDKDVPTQSVRARLKKSCTLSSSVARKGVQSTSMATDSRDKQTGELKDHTTMLHSLVHQGSFESYKVEPVVPKTPENLQAGVTIVSHLPYELWAQILEEMTPVDAANLAFSCKAFQYLLAWEAWEALKHPDNLHHRVNFLVNMDRIFPQHLFCFLCAKYHVRTKPGEEILKPAHILNPLYNCPNIDRIPPRIRLTAGRNLPFTFVQLAMRAERHSPAHGITVDLLSRRFKDKDSPWSHQTRFAIVNGHLLMRVISTCFAAPGLAPASQRALLYNREDFVPYFSVCAHWRDGELMPSVKCALTHIPKPLEGDGLIRLSQEVKQRMNRPAALVTLCSKCRAMRRCPQCPSEYLIEVKIAEDKSDSTNLFKQALVVTRWSDLGDGLFPWSPEWAACSGEGEYDSLALIGRRAVSGVFESQFNGEFIPGQRILSMNPKNEKKGEAGHNWY